MTIDLIVRVARSDPSNNDHQIATEMSLRRIDSQDAETAVVGLLKRCLDGQPTNASRPRTTTNRPQNNRRLATEKQVRAIEIMAKKQGFDLRRFLADEAGASTLKALTIGEASNLIDRLKSVAA